MTSRSAGPVVVLVAVCALLAPAPAATREGEVDSLSLEECVALARLRAPEARAVEAEREAAGRDSVAVSRNRRPSFSWFGGPTVAPRGFYDPVSTNLGAYELKAGAELPLLDGGGRRRERTLGALAARGARLESARAGRDAGLRAAALALATVRARDQLAVLRETLVWLEHLDALVGSGVRGGTRSRSDADRVALERNAVGSELESLEQSQGELQRELAELIGRPPERPLGIRDPTGAAGEAPPPADSSALLERATAAPEVQAARITLARHEVAVDEARRRNAVRVDIAGDAGLWGSDLTRAVPPELAAAKPGATLADRLRGDLGASVSLRFRRSVLDAAAAPALAARERERDAAAIRAEAALAARRRWTLDLLGRWRSAARRLALAEAASALGEQHLLRLRSLYAAGATTLIELLDARRQFDDARGRLADARFESRLARWEGEFQR